MMSAESTMKRCRHTSKCGNETQFNSAGSGDFAISPIEGIENGGGQCAKKTFSDSESCVCFRFCLPNSVIGIWVRSTGGPLL